MGLTHSSQWHGVSSLDGEISKKLTYTAALAGNPNVGKSSIFNYLTGMNQHTGNWTGKTVAKAVGNCVSQDITFIDLPGTYSVRARSPEEVVAEDFITSGNADVTVVVCDALCLERGLSLALQITEITPKVILCINLMDEAEKCGLSIDTEKLSGILGIPVSAVSAKRGTGFKDLCEKIRTKASQKESFAASPLTYSPAVEEEINRLLKEGHNRRQIIKEWLSDSPADIFLKSLERLPFDTHSELREELMKRPVIVAEGIACEVTDGEPLCGYSPRDRKIDKIITNPLFGVPIMLIMLAGIFYLTIIGSNYPSMLLQGLFDRIEAFIYNGLSWLNIPLRELIVSGMLRTLFRVVAVMLPPMAIFFPLFTLMEDFGLLGRIAFNLDGAFCRASACGKQALTMCMGLGCNAAGVVGCRIIDSPRERIIAILTNNFMPCNGRFPILISMAALLTLGSFGGILGTVIMLLAVVSGVLLTLAVSKLLSLTILKGESSSFTLELPPYRPPNVGKVIVRSIFDRTVYVLGRAAAVAAPAGIVIWLLANTFVAGMSLFSHISSFFDPFGKLIGLDGVVITAFILGFPANEIVLPIILMGYTAAGSLGDGEALGLLAANGWNTLSYLNMIILTLFHFPCSTTILTIKKETGSLLYTVLSAIIPTVIGIILCAITTAAASILAA